MRKLSRVVVSGATSFLGAAVIKKLLERNCEIFGIVRPDSKARNMLPNYPQFHEISCDICDTTAWLEAIGRADTFFHFAWGGPGIQGRADSVVQRQSADHTLAAVEAAVQLGVSRFFFSGSQAEYGRTKGKITENTPCSPILEYGKNKLAVCRTVTELAKKLGVEYVHGRFFSVYGPNDHPYTLVPSCIRAFLKDETIALSECTNLWNFLHVDDAAEAAVQLTECALDESSVIVNIAGSDTRILREYVEEIFRLCGEKGKCAFGARHVSEEPVDNWPDISRLQGLIDWQPRVAFEDGIKELIVQEKGRMEKPV